MSVRATSAVWAHSQAAGNDLLVLLALADYIGKDDDHCWPSQQSLATKTRLSLSTVRRSIRYLEQLGELVTEPGAGPRHEGARTPLNAYRLSLLTGQSDRTKTGQSDRPSGPARPVNLTQKTGQNDAEDRSAVTDRKGMNREEPGGRTPPAFPTQCSRHQDGPHDDPCWACRRAREGHEQEPPQAPPRPTWCGHCDERTRLVETDRGMAHCAACHPLQVVPA